MPTALPPRTANKQASRLSAVMFTLVAAMLTMLIALFGLARTAASTGFAFVPTLNQRPTNSYD